jgi:hypothetical protein
VNSNADEEGEAANFLASVQALQSAGTSDPFILQSFVFGRLVPLGLKELVKVLRPKELTVRKALSLPAS